MNTLPDMLKMFVPRRWRRPSYWVEQRILDTTGLRVAKGPFRGMVYCREGIDEWSTGKLLGTYEQELHHKIEDMCVAGIDNFVNVGASDGYYSVGFLMRCPTCMATAFESVGNFHGTMKRLAALNGVEQRLDIRGYCDVADLADVLEPGRRSAVLMDVEGFEAQLLSPAQVPQLCSAHILVETHDFLDPTITDILKRRFADSHAIETVYSTWRCLADVPFGLSFLERQLLKKYYLMSMWEGRGAIMHWLYMTPKATGN